VFLHREDGVACSPGRVVVSLCGIGGFGELLAWVAGGSQRFCVHEPWWIQDNPGGFRTGSAVLCTEFLLLGEREEKEKGNEKTLSLAIWHSSQQPQCLGFWGFLCYKKLIGRLVIVH
jgi:hypothetical protein